MKNSKINRISKILLYVVLFAFFLIAQLPVYSNNLYADECDTVRVSGAATKDGSIFLAANPDGPTNFGMVPGYIPREKHSPGEMRKLSSGDEIPEVEETYAFVGLNYRTGKYGVWPPELSPELSKASFWGGINEHGVSMGLIGLGMIGGENIQLKVHQR